MKLSKNFSDTEFKCQGKNCCGGCSPMNYKLIDNLQAVRDAINIPIKINSGFRCLTHNKEVGGVEKSYHTLGYAADLALPDDEHIAKFISSVNLVFGGVGFYDTFIHVDIRTRKMHNWNKTTSNISEIYLKFINLLCS